MQISVRTMSKCLIFLYILPYLVLSGISVNRFLLWRYFCRSQEPLGVQVMLQQDAKPSAQKQASNLWHRTERHLKGRLHAISKCLVKSILGTIHTSHQNRGLASQVYPQTIHFILVFVKIHFVCTMNHTCNFKKLLCTCLDDTFWVHSQTPADEDCISICPQKYPPVSRGLSNVCFDNYTDYHRTFVGRNINNGAFCDVGVNGNDISFNHFYCLCMRLS